MRTLLMALFGAVLVTLMFRASAEAAEPVTLAPITHADVTLDHLDRAGLVKTYSPVMLEELPNYRLRTKTPWRHEEATFEGTLLRDLLAVHGMDQLSGIRVFPENDYTTIVEREIWEGTQFVIATRVDGHALTRRARGLIQFIVASKDGTLPAPDDERQPVWMARRIEVGD